MAEPSDNPQFFQVIVEQHQLHQLYIPKKFVSYNGDKLSSGWYCLRVPGITLTWEVEIIKTKNRVTYFRKGWPEFCKCFSLDLGNFVVFEYTGDKKFDVVIFNTSGVEIEYQSYLDQNEMDIESDDSISDNLVESSEEEQVTTDDDDYVEDVNADDIDDESYRISSDEKFSDQSLIKPEKGIKSKAVDDSTSIPPAITEHCWDLDNPKNFKIKMRRTYISRKCTVHVPTKHAIKYLVTNEAAKQGGLVKLIVKCTDAAHSRPSLIWSVYYRLYYKKEDYVYTKLSKGFYEFVEDNSIEEQDVCLFQLIDVESKLYNVSIIRMEKTKDRIKQMKPKDRSTTTTTAAKVPGSCSSAGRGYLHSLGRIEFTKVMQKWAQQHGIKRVFFSVRMSPAYVGPAKYVHIPYSHAKVHFKNLHGKKNCVLLSVENNDKTWEVNCSVDKELRNSKFEAGWPVFVKENGIIATDICIFELVDPKAREYTVHTISSLQMDRDVCALVN